MPTSTKVRKRGKKGPIQLPTREEAKALRKRARDKKTTERFRETSRGLEERARDRRNRNFFSQGKQKNPHKPGKQEKNKKEEGAPEASRSISPENGGKRRSENRIVDYSDAEKHRERIFVQHGESGYMRRLHPVRTSEMPFINPRVNGKPGKWGPKRAATKNGLDWLQNTIKKQPQAFFEANKMLFVFVLDNQLSDPERAPVAIPSENRYYTSARSTYRRGRQIGDVPDGTALIEVLNLKGPKYAGWNASHEPTNGAQPRLLEDAGLLSVSNYAPGRCRTYSVPTHLLADFCCAEHEGLEKKTRYNLYTGNRMSKLKGETTRMHDSSRNRYPDVICNSLEAMQDRVPFNRPAIIEHVGERFKEYQLAETEAHRLVQDLYNLERKYPDFEVVKRIVQSQYEGGKTSEEYRSIRCYERARGRWLNDWRCFRTIKQQAARPESDDIWTYTPAWKVLKTGRIAEIGGGLQSGSGEMKKAARDGIQYYNYDIVSCHPTFLLTVEFDRAGISCQWLEAYKENEDAKHEAAHKIGCSVKTWKRCCYSIFMHAKARKSNTWKDGEKGWQSVKYAPYEYLSACHEVDDPDAALVRFKRYTRSLRDALSKYRNWLEAEVLSIKPENGAGRIRKNAAGRPFYVDEHLKENGRITEEGKRRLAAHMLQGHESCFVHTLVRLLVEAGINVLSNEHDGLITDQVVPEATVEEARLTTGYHAVKLERKALA